MTDLKTAGRQVFADNDLGGNPADVDKALARAWSDLIADAVGLNFSQGLAFEDEADAAANLDYPENTGARIPGEGIYQKQGASGAGSWLKIADDEFGILTAQITNLFQPLRIIDSQTGTGDTINVTLPGGLSAWQANRLYYFDSRTAPVGPPQIKLGSGPAIPICDSFGAQVEADNIEVLSTFLAVYRTDAGDGYLAVIAGSWTTGETDIGISDIDGLQAKLDLLDLAAPIYCSVAGTPNALVATPQRPHAAYVQDQLYYFRPTAANTTAGVTLKVGSLAALPIYNEVDGSNPGVGRFVALRTYIVRYSTAFSGSFYIVYPSATTADLNAMRVIRTIDLETGADENTINAQAPYPEAAYRTDTLYRITPGRTSSGSLKYKLGSLAEITVQEETGEPTGPGRATKGREMDFRYHAGLNAMLIESPKRHPVYAANARRGVQMAESAMRSARLRYLADHPPGSISRTTIYDKTYDIEGDALALKKADDDGAGGPVYVSLTHDSAGGAATWTPGANGAWWDPNHRDLGPGHLNLLAVFNTAINSGGPVPNVSDLRNARMTLDLEAVNLKLPRGARLMLHFQSSGVVGGVTRYFNYLHCGTILDEALGSKGHGLGWPPQPDVAGLHIVTLNGSGVVTVDFTPDPAFWLDLGSSWTRFDQYLPLPVEQGMQMTLRNIQIVVLHDQTDIGTVTPPVRPTGALKIRSAKLEIAS